MQKIDTVIFDLGGVLIDWNPKYLYRKIFQSEEKVDWFLNNICTSEWNDQQDAGRSFDEATAELIAKFPELEEPIRAWYGRWQETIRGPIGETVAILEEIRALKKFRLYALTNWSAETFPWAFENFHFLSWFEGIVVSGIEKTRKPHPEFFNILFDRFQVDPKKSVFIDDNLKNIEGGKAVGLNTIHYLNPAETRQQLMKLGVL